MVAYRSMSRVLSFALCAVWLSPVLARGAAATPEAAAADPGWPREYKDGKARLLLYQPQIDSWKDFKSLTGRFAMELTPAKGVPAVHGTLRAEAETRVNLESRTVSYTNFTFLDIRYPSAANEEEAEPREAIGMPLLRAKPTISSITRNRLAKPHLAIISNSWSRRDLTSAPFPGRRDVRSPYNLPAPCSAFSPNTWMGVLPGGRSSSGKWGVPRGSSRRQRSDISRVAAIASG